MDKPIYDGTMVQVRSGDNYYIIQTYSRKLGRSRCLYLGKTALDSHVVLPDYNYIERDICSYANISMLPDDIHLEILWLEFSGNDISGHREKIVISKDVFYRIEQGQEIKFLYKEPPNTTKYFTTPGVAPIVKEVLKDNRVKRALLKYFRDHSSGAGTCVLYGDGKRDFYFKYRGPWMGYDGGIILSDYQKKNGRPRFEYTTHT